MKRSRVFFICMFSCFLAVATNIKAGNTIKTERLPDNYQIMFASEPTNFPSGFVECVAWPDANRIKRGRIENNNPAVSNAIANTVKWLQTILKPQWVPDESSLDVFAFKADTEGIDAIRFRYKIDGVIIQIRSTASTISVIITDDKQNLKQFSEEEAKLYVTEKIERFLNNSEKIKNISLNKITRDKACVRGYADVKPESLNYWWGLMSWWTDGNSVLFSTGKADGGPLAPTLKKHWFSPETTQQ